VAASNLLTEELRQRFGLVSAATPFNHDLTGRACTSGLQWRLNPQGHRESRTGVDQFARIVLGYHGCNTPESVDFARRLFDGSGKIADWQPSNNNYDWLGRGIYFWEYGPARARLWAGENGSVIGAIIQLGRCFDLTDVNDTGLLQAAYDSVVALHEEEGLVLPQKEGRELKLRKLDCLVINSFMDTMESELDGATGAYRYQTVRCAFEEGNEAFPGSMLKKETHIQIAVRDMSCILGVFRPNI
jgi:hypothetical protein